MMLHQALADVQRLFVETAPLIYFIEEHPVHLERMHVIMQEVDAGTLTAVTSVITLTEVLTQPLRTKQHDIVQAYRDILLHSPNMKLAIIDAAIAERAAALRALHNLKTPDALQVAAAIHTGCDALLTNDSDLERVQSIRVLILDELELDSTENETT
jgi:predicted nucleic acid-binding protein